jgi:hypothetical protein
LSFILLGLLSTDSPELSNELLAEKLIEYFSSQKDFSLEFEEVPLTGDIVLNLRFGEWHATVSYEEDEVVKEDSLEIQNRTANFKVHDVSNIDRRVRVIFGNDDKREYTNETVYLMDFLCNIHGIIVYDPQQNNFM